MAPQRKTFPRLFSTRADAEKLAGMSNSYLFDIEGEGKWHVVVADGAIQVTEGEADADTRQQARDRHARKRLFLALKMRDLLHVAGFLRRRAGLGRKGVIATTPATALPRSTFDIRSGIFDTRSGIFGRSILGRSNSGRCISESERAISARSISGKWSSGMRTSLTGSSGI